MSAPQIDAELLAAFLDGTATSAERNDVLRLIARSREAYAEFSEAVAIREGLHVGVSLAALQPNDLPAADVSPPLSESGRVTERRFRLVLPVAVMAAAGLAIAFLARVKASAPDSRVITIAQAMRVEGATGSGSLVRTLGTDWDMPGWSVSRGTESRLSTHARAFRVGVRYGMLQIAINASDSSAVLAESAQLQMLLNDVDGSAESSAKIAALSTQLPAQRTAAMLAIARSMRAGLVDADWFDLGAWNGVALVATRDNRLTFFAEDGAAIATLGEVFQRRAQPADAWHRATKPLRDVWQTENAPASATLPLALAAILGCIAVAGS